METKGDPPVKDPVLTDLLVRRLVEESKTEPELAHAFDTLIRHSDAGECARKIGLKAAGYKASEEIDGSGLFIMSQGSAIHESLQECIADEYGPLATIEARVRFGDLSSSGHIDALIDLPNRRMALELKTKGGFAFDKAIGVDRKGYKWKTPEGPGTGALLQGALNALAADADELVIGYLSREAISKQLAEKLGMEDHQRVVAEWRYPRSTWEPWAQKEKIRLAQILDAVAHDVLPDRFAVDDHMKLEKLNPDLAKPSWRCSYCSFNSLCKIAGPGEPVLPIEGVPWPGEEAYKSNKENS
jgi:hypothetical protein